MPSPVKSVLCHYRYDPLDRLVDCSPMAQANTRRFYLKERLTCEIHGAVQRSVFQHDDQLLAQQRRQGGAVETTLLATDQQRSVLHSLDTTGPHLLAYTPYGHRPPPNGLLSLLGFNGERPDPVTGHYLLGNGYRAFSPVMMRFNSPDSWSPFGEGGLNAYAYCVGDPVNRNDPTGKFPTLLSKIVGHIDNLKSAKPVIADAAITKAPLATAATGPSFAEDILRISKQSLLPSGLPKEMSQPRKQLDQSLASIKSPSRFANSVMEVNRNLASHGNESLTMVDARRYAELSEASSSGKISQTYAHLTAASMWAKKLYRHRDPNGLVGGVFNLAGALGSGVHDSHLYKTGAVLRKST
jgi:RHS repeat-associated protein